MKEVVVAHRNVKNWSDRVAIMFVKTLRFGLDLATGYKKEAGGMTGRQYVCSFSYRSEQS